MTSAILQVMVVLVECKKVLDKSHFMYYNICVMPIMGHIISTCYKEK